MKDDDGGLRHRLSKAATHTSAREEESSSVATSAARQIHSNTSNPTTTTAKEATPMVGQFRRGPVLAYRSGGSIATTSQQRTNYKNKILIALGATILYTAFLYRSGKKSGLGN